MDILSQLAALIVAIAHLIEVVVGKDVGLTFSLTVNVAFGAGWGLRAHWVKKSPDRIYQVVRASLTAALCTPGPASIGKASAFISTLERYLGPLLAVAEANKLANDLKTAIEGKAKALSPAAAPAGTAAVGAASASAAAGGAAAAAAVGPGGVAVVTAPPLAPSTKDQVRQVREALEAFDDYWRKDRILAQFARAQEALLDPPKPPKGVGAHH